jgi:hypothetical protein
MDHTEAVRQKATEKYLLDELDPEVRDQFEEHMFGCQECALDLRAAAMFVEQSRVVLAEEPVIAGASVTLPDRKPRRRWNWLRPAFTVPVFALLLAVIGYQNLVTYPHLMRESDQPRLGAWAAINLSTRGAEAKVVRIKPGQGFALQLNIPPDSGYSAYTFQLYNPAGKLQWTDRISASSPDDAQSIYVPGAALEQGTYKLETEGVTAAGQSLQTGSNPIEVQIQR